MNIADETIRAQFAKMVYKPLDITNVEIWTCGKEP